MTVYFTFELSRIYDKELESEMTKHMSAKHFKKQDIGRAVDLLHRIKKYSQEQQIPDMGGTEIQIRKKTVYRIDNGLLTPLDMTKHVDFYARDNKPDGPDAAADRPHE